MPFLPLLDRDNRSERVSLPLQFTPKIANPTETRNQVFTNLCGSIMYVRHSKHSLDCTEYIRTAQKVFLFRNRGLGSICAHNSAYISNIGATPANRPSFIYSPAMPSVNFPAIPSGHSLLLNRSATPLDIPPCSILYLVLFFFFLKNH